MAKISKKQLEQIITEEVQSALVDEGFLSSIGKGIGKMVGDFKSGYQQGRGDSQAPGGVSADKMMAQIALFIQAAERDLRDEILKTDLGNKLFSTEMMNEQYGEKQLFQMMKRKGISMDQMNAFVKAMQAIPAAKQFLKLAGLPESPADAPGAEAGGEQEVTPDQVVSSEPAAQADAAAQAKPQMFNVEKGKASLQQQLTQKYASQIGPEATKFINAIVRDIKADLAASGVQVQESAEQIGSKILQELLSADRDVRILFEAATQADVEALRAEIAKLEQAMKSSPPEARRFQERELEKLKAKRNAATAEVRAGVEKAAADKAAADKKSSLMQKKVARDDAAQKMKNMQQGRMADKEKADVMKKALQTKRISKPGVVDVNQAVLSKLAALKKLNPELAKKIDAVTPQIMKAVMKYVNYVLKTSGKAGQVKVLAKIQAPAAAKPAAGTPPPVPVAEHKELDRWKKLAKING